MSDASLHGIFLHINSSNMKLKEMCADEMPREKMLSKGAGALSNTDLIAILLRTGRGGANVIDVAREILLRGGGKLNNLAEMSIDRLCSIEGIGPGKAVTIAAAFELGRRTSIEKISDSKTPLSSPKAVYKLMFPHVRHLKHEECWILYLNKANMMIDREMISRGGMDSTIIDNRIIISKALEKKAIGIIIIHNHPSGNALPSIEDIKMTQLLNKALKTCNISLIDHVIISRDSYYSFADEQLYE